MSKKYIVNSGDTLSTISQRFYGTPSKYMEIFDASNFKSGDPAIIHTGEVAYIPEIDELENIAPRIDNDEVVISIEDQNFYGWQGLVVALSILNFADTFSFSFPYDENSTLKEFIQPYKYPLVQIYIGNELILTGRIEYSQISSTPDSTNINIQGRSLIGIALDSQIDTIKQYNNQNLSKIAQEILTRYGVGVIIEQDVLIKKANISVGASTYNFFKSFLQENDLLIYSTPDGKIKLTIADSSTSGLQTIKLGEGKVQKIDTIFNGTNMASSYKIYTQSPLGINKKAVVQNPFVDIYKPFVKVQNDIVDIDVATKGFYLTSLGKSNIINIRIASWRDKNGQLWKKNTSIILDAPINYIIRPTKFLITNVQLAIDNSEQIATLACVMPQIYSKEDIKQVFWK